VKQGPQLLKRRDLPLLNRLARVSGTNCCAGFALRIRLEEDRRISAPIIQGCLGCPIDGAHSVDVTSQIPPFLAIGLKSQDKKPPDEADECT
jgi:hypothetical protein